MIFTLLFFVSSHILIKVILKVIDQSHLQPKATENTVPDEPKQLMELRKQRKQIVQTMERFNTPSTFAKYSKMQRQIIKLDEKIRQLEQVEAEAQQFEQQQPNRSLISRTTAVRFGITACLILVGTLVDLGQVPDKFAIFPVSLFLDGRNHASGASVVLLSKLLL